MDPTNPKKHCLRKGKDEEVKENSIQRECQQQENTSSRFSCFKNFV